VVRRRVFLGTPVCRVPVGGRSSPAGLFTNMCREDNIVVQVPGDARAALTTTRQRHSPTNCCSFIDAVHTDNCTPSHRAAAPARDRPPFTLTAGTAKRALAIVILSVRLSVRQSQPGTDSSPGEIDSRVFTV